tara:strand:- start:4851 stop:5705 length:855 start_codon:yes stop_codon:yes gene_type:complete
MKYAIGIDLGGKKISGVLIDENGIIIKTALQPTLASRPRREILDTIEEVIEELSVKKIQGVGIGHPGFSMNHKLTSIHNIPDFEGMDIVKEIGKRVGGNVYAENDANCFTVAEHAYGAVKRYSNAFGIIIGSGIGGGIIIDNKLYRGTHGGAGEVGFMHLGDKTFEQYGSGKYIMETYWELGGSRNHETAAEVFNSKSKIAKRLTKEVFEYYAKGFAAIINILDPEAIVIGGGVSKSYDLFIHPLKDSLSQYAPNANTDRIAILKNKLGDDSGVIGAARLVFEG